MNLIDWSKVPRGVMTNKGELISCSNGIASILQSSGFAFRMLHTDADTLRIIPAARWTYHDGGECPVPNGVTFDIIFRDSTTYSDQYPTSFIWSSALEDDDIIAYRITGVDRAGGFTDDPSEVTE